MGPEAWGTRDLAQHIASARGAAAQLAKLNRVINSAPPDYSPGERGYVTLRDVIMDTGLHGLKRKCAEEGIQQIVNESRSMVDIARDMRDIGIEGTLIPILLKRGQKLAQEARNSGRNVVYKSAPAGAGWESIPTGRKGGYRRHKAHGGYEYAYPDGKGGHEHGDEPHAGDSASVHEDHASAKPDPKVAAAYEKVVKRGKAMGINVEARPHAGTTMANVKRLDAEITAHEAAGSDHRKKDADEGDNIEDEEEDAHTEEVPKPEAKDDGEDDPTEEVPKDEAESDEPEDDNLTAAIMKLAKQKGVPEDSIKDAIAAVSGDDEDTEAELRTIHDYLAAMDDAEPDEAGDEAGDSSGEESERVWSGDDAPEIPGLGHDVPDSPHEKAALQERVKTLEAALQTMESHLEAHEKDLHKQLQREARLIRRQPSPQAVGWLHTRVRAFAILALGAAAGLILGGPMGVLLGLTAADKIAKLDSADHHRRADAEARDEARTAGSEEMKATAEEMKARAQELKDKLNDASEELAGKDATPDEEPDEEPEAPAPKAKRRGGPKVAKSLSRRLRRPVTFGDPVFIDGRIVVLFPKAQRLLKSMPIPLGLANDGSQPTPAGVGGAGGSLTRSETLVGGAGDNRPDSDFDPEALADGTRHEMEHTDDAAAAKEIAKDHLSEDPQYYVKLRQLKAEKALPPPPAYVPNAYGLTPGERLYVRKGPAWDTCPEVKVLAHSAFFWNGERYHNATALLKAVTGRDRPGTTIKRYFRLGSTQHQFIKSLAYQLGEKYPGVHFTAYGGAVRASGDLAAHGISATLLSATDAKHLLSGDDNAQ